MMVWVAKCWDFSTPRLLAVTVTKLLVALSLLPNPVPFALHATNPIDLVLKTMRGREKGDYGVHNSGCWRTPAAWG